MMESKETGDVQNTVITSYDNGTLSKNEANDVAIAGKSLGKNVTGKMHVGTGDIDNSDNTLKGATVTDSDVKVTTNNITNVEVKDGGTVVIKDASAVHAEAEERRKDWDNTMSNIKSGAQSLYEQTPMGCVTKNLKNLKSAIETDIMKKNERFDSAINMQTPANTEANNALSK